MDVLTAAQNVAEDFKGGARALALAIDRNPVTFSHEVSETGTAKLGLRTAVKMTIRSKDPRILNAFAAECGYMVLPLPEGMAVEGDEAMQLMAKAVAEFNDVAQEYLSGGADGEWTGNELSRLERQHGELVAASQRLVAHARAKHEAAKPSHIRSVG
jgi:hypothetical protein